jgi:hypothetical protein
MSPNVGNFVHDLVEMAKAMEMLPTVQAELEDARSKVEAAHDRIQSLELRLIDRANEIDDLNAKIKEAEQARDSAETMFLETDDKLLAFRRLVSAFSTDAATLLRAQEPEAKQEPTPVTQAELNAMPSVDADGNYHPGTPQQGQSEAGEQSQSHSDHAAPVTSPSPVETSDHTASDSSGVSVPADPTQATESSYGSASGDWAQHQQLDYTQGQSDGGPTAPSGDGPTPSPVSAPTDAADTVADAPASASEPHGPYHDKKWSEVTPRVYNYMDWERGGGSSANFNL